MCERDSLSWMMSIILIRGTLSYKDAFIFWWSMVINLTDAADRNERKAYDGDNWDCIKYLQGDNE